MSVLLFIGMVFFARKYRKWKKLAQIADSESNELFDKFQETLVINLEKDITIKDRDRSIAIQNDAIVELRAAVDEKEDHLLETKEDKRLMKHKYELYLLYIRKHTEFHLHELSIEKQAKTHESNNSKVEAIRSAISEESENEVTEEDKKP